MRTLITAVVDAIDAAPDFITKLEIEYRPLTTQFILHRGDLQTAFILTAGADDPRDVAAYYVRPSLYALGYAPAQGATAR